VSAVHGQAVVDCAAGAGAADGIPVERLLQ